MRDERVFYVKIVVSIKICYRFVFESVDGVAHAGRGTGRWLCPRGDTAQIAHQLPRGEHLDGRCRPNATRKGVQEGHPVCKEESASSASCE